MLTPLRAIVRPRVIGSEGSVALPIDEVVADLLDGGDQSAIQIVGGPGGGKTTALKHLAAVLEPGASNLPAPRAVAESTNAAAGGCG